jgi:hypothetical protein
LRYPGLEKRESAIMTLGVAMLEQAYTALSPPERPEKFHM